MQNMQKLCVALAMCLSLGACATGPLVPPSDTVVLAQGETGLELGYNVAAKAYKSRAPTMAPALKARLKPILADAFAAIRAAATAELLGDATAIDTQVKGATALIAQANSLLGIK